MQSLGRISTKGTLYSDADVTARINANTGAERWIFDQLDAEFNYTGDLTGYVNYDQAPKISHDSTAAVKRKLKITLSGAVPLTVLSDLLRVHYQLQMPDGGFVDWVLGTFTIMPPAKSITTAVTWRTLAATDIGQLLVDGAFTSSYGVSQGQSVLSGIEGIVATMGGKTPIKIGIPDPNKAFPANFLLAQPGETRLAAINRCLAAVNYVDAWFDEMGVMRSGPVPDYNTIAPGWTWDATVTPSVVKIPITEAIDMSNACNQVVVLIEDPRRTPIYVLYENVSPDSPVSLSKWHPRLKLVRDSSIVDAEAAYAKARTLAQEGARIYSKITVPTWPWALSQNLDVYGLVYETEDEGLVNANHLETAWDHECRVGASSSHTLSRIVAA